MRDLFLINNNKVTLVDDEDYDYLNQWEWGLSKNGYVIRDGRKEGRSRTIFIHREILDLYSGDKRICHHVNENKTDNYKKNLLVTTNVEHAKHHFTGRHQTEEAKKAISRARKGKPRLKSTLEKMSNNRKGKCIGEDNFRAVITWEIVKQIRKDYLNGQTNIAALARKYKVSWGIISHVVKNETWVDINNNMPTLDIE